jgi:gamma-glutamyltranspeptidase/glutathione hydrolase
MGHLRVVHRVRCAAVLLVLLLAAGCAGPRASGTFAHAAVAADHATASEAGAEMLRRGGNAVDAAVATSFTLSVVRPESCGIGGGGFMVVRLSDAGAERLARLGRAPAKREVAINYREMCPAGVGEEFFEKRADAEASTRGGAAVAVPGTVAGLLHALETYGTMDRATVLAPAIAAAENGFAADAHYVEGARGLAASFEKHPEWKRRFAFVWERYLREGKVARGDTIKVPEQAAALRLIAERGAEGFYGGEVGRAIVEAARGDGGVLSEADLRGFRVAESEPLRFDFLAWQFLTMPPPSSGGVAMGEALGIFQSLYEQSMSGPSPEPRSAFHGALLAHALVESLKHAFADRSRWLGDPEFSDVPAAHLISRTYTGALAGTFNPEHTLDAGMYGTREVAPPEGAATDDHGTSHFSVVDADGSAVACTETVNLEFGSCLAVPRFGIILNDQMDDFTTRRGKANAFGLVQSDRNLPAPGKRPLSSMTPTIVVDEQGRVAAVAGASGGPRIISGTMQVLLNALLWGEPAAQAVGAPRLHHQWKPDILRVEEAGLAQGGSVMDGLRARGHTVEPVDAVGNVQLIKRTDAGWEAACDPRKGGRPAGN